MATNESRRRIPEATVARLPVYLRILSEPARRRRSPTCRPRSSPSSPASTPPRCARTSATSAATAPAASATRSSTSSTRSAASSASTHDWPVVIVGAGNLGQALAGYGGFGDRGFPVAGIVDIDAAKVGSVDRRRAGPPRSTTCPSIVRARPRVDRRRRHARAAPPRRPPTASSPPASRASSTSPRSCSPCRDGINVRKVDLAVELQILSYYEQRRTAAAGHRCRPYRPGPDGGPARRLDPPCRSSSSGSTTAPVRWRSSSG